MQSLERIANADGHTYAIMMERAGSGVAEIIKSTISTSDHILVLVGPGNNGGDGLVAARILHNEGYNVIAYLSRQRNPETDNVFAQALDNGVPLLYAEHEKDSTSLIRCVKSANVIVDALLGTGSSPPIRGTIANILRAVHETMENESKPAVLDLSCIPQHL